MNSLKIYLFAAFSFLCFKETMSCRFIEKEFGRFYRQMKFEKVNDPNISIDSIFNLDTSIQLSYYSVEIDSIGEIGVLQNYFGFKSGYNDFNIGMHDKYLLMYIAEYEIFVLFLNNMNNAVSITEKIHSGNVFMPNKMVYAFLFDIKKQYIGSIKVFPKRAMLFPKIELDANCTNKVSDNVLDSKLTYEDFINSSLGEVFNNINEIVKKSNVLSEKKVSCLLDFKRNFFIRNF